MFGDAALQSLLRPPPPRPQRRECMCHTAAEARPFDLYGVAESLPDYFGPYRIVFGRCPVKAPIAILEVESSRRRVLRSRRGLRPEVAFVGAIAPSVAAASSPRSSCAPFLQQVSAMTSAFANRQAPAVLAA